MKKHFKNCVAILMFLLGIFSTSELAYAQTWAQTQDQIKENTNHIQNINEKITDLRDNYHLLYEGAKNQNDQLGNQISFTNHFLGVISLAFTLMGLVLALYINRQYEKIKEMRDIVEIAKKAIDGHATDLYKKLKREETMSLLKRLEEVPEDITNIIHSLLSRDLFESDFACLKEAYSKVKNSLPVDNIAKGSYMTLLLQHFTYESLKDQDLKDEITLNINAQNLHNMFHRDIKNFFDQIFRYLKEFGIDEEKNKIIIKNLFYNYSRSKFNPNPDLQNYIKETLAKHQMKTNDVASILKQQAPTDTVYIAWVDVIFG